jgi:5-oxoprolinase (ATP-hydrolysing)
VLAGIGVNGYLSKTMSVVLEKVLIRICCNGLRYEEVIEVDERVQLALSSSGNCEVEGLLAVKGVSGEMVEVVKPLDEECVRPLLQGLLDKGITCLAVLFLHSYTFPEHEQRVEQLAKSLGFKQVSTSSSLVPMVRAVPRGLTATVDAYLTPVIREYLSGFLSGFDEGLEKVGVSFMQSDGGLTPEHRFSGHKAILSGPAGGVVGYAQTTFGMETQQPIIGFDMGGTSTDVSRYAGSYEQVLETQTAGIIIQVNFSGLCYCPLKYAVLTGWVLGLVE